MFLTSTQKLYQKIAEGEYSSFTVPAFNIRTLTFDVARALFRAAKREKTGAFIVELAQSEMSYTDQLPKEYVKYVTKAARKEDFEGPLFFQGDHFRPNSGNLPPTFGTKVGGLENLIKEAIEAGFYNIDIDGSVLDDLEENASQTAKYTALIRKLEPKDLTISVGGEVSEIGGENTKVEELREFMASYSKALSKHGDLKGLIKIAVQTGTAHGKGGKTDFQLLENLREKAREYNIAGVVQHGSSTLLEEEFKKFPAAGVLEIHLATEFQNMILSSPYFPQKLRQKIHSKKDLGIFKKEIWNIPQKNIDKICEELEEKFIFFFKKLNVSGTLDLIKKIYSK